MYISKLNLFDISSKDLLSKAGHIDNFDVSVFDFAEDDTIIENLIKSNEKIEEIFEMFFKDLQEGSETENEQEIEGIAGETENTNEEEILDKLFVENITEEDFKNELDNLTAETEEGAVIPEYLTKINELGAKNVFSAIDTNNDGILNSSELENLKEENENGKISEEKLNNIFNILTPKQEQTVNVGVPEASPHSEETAVSQTPLSANEGVQANNNNNNDTTPEITSEESAKTVKETKKTKKTKKAKKTKKHKSSSSSSSDYESKDLPKPEPKETSTDLINKKKEIISTADSEIGKLHKEIDGIIQDSDTDKTLKEDYESAKEVYEENENTIKENDSKLVEYDENLHNIDKSIVSLNAELNAINENTQGKEISDKVSVRKEEIRQELSDLETQKERIETLKRELEEKNRNAKEDSVRLKSEMDEAYKALEEKLSPETKIQIQGLKSQISKLETDKQTEISKIDGQIQTLKAEELEESRANGERAGKNATNTIGEQIVNDALQYVGYHGNSDGSSMFHSGGGGWCSAFVEYIVKEVGKENNIDYDKLDSHTSPAPMNLYTMNKEHSYNTNGYSKNELQNIVKPGMAFICKGGGKSGYHVGIVENVNDDGTFNTIEGNYGNRVAQSQRSLKGVYYFVDFTYLFE